MDTQKWLRKRLTFGAALVSLSILAACSSGSSKFLDQVEEEGGGSSDSGEAAGTGGELIYAVASEPGAWDIHVEGTDIVAGLQRNVFDSLVSQSNDGEFHPWLAKSWEINDDGTTYRFELREDVTFHDGEPFNAEAVKANMDHIVAEETQSQYAVGLLGSYKDTEVIDEFTVEVHLEAPYAALMQSLSTAYLGFYSPKALENPDDLTKVTEAIGTGPFKVGNFMAGQQIQYVANEDYNWAPANAAHDGRAHLDSLTVRFIPEDSARIGALTSGEIHIAGGVPPSEAAGLESNDQIKLDRAEDPGIPYTLFLNNSRAPLNDVDVRKAIQIALPIDDMVETIYFGEYNRAWSPLSASTPGYDSSLENSYAHDVAAAEDLLDAAGWIMGSDGIREKDGAKLVLEWPMGQAQREQRDVVAQSIKAELADIGIQVNVSPEDVGTYMNHLMSVDYDIIDWSFVRSDADALRLHFHSDRKSTRLNSS